MRKLPEAELLISCSREDASSVMSTIEANAGDVDDWNEVIGLSESHRIAPLVLPVFKKLAEGGHIPDSAVQDLSEVARSNVITHMNHRLALKQLLTALEEHSTPVIVMKGAAIGSLLYDKPEVRTSGDIDLLCKEEDFGTIHDCLESLGYVAGDDSMLPERHSHNETHFERHYLHMGKRVHVELHVDEMKLGIRPKHQASIWERTIVVNIDGSNALALCPEDQVLSLSVHLHRHGFNRLIWFKDLDLLIRKWHGRIDWDRVIQEAKIEGAESSLWYTFNFLQKLLDTPMPQDVMARLKPNLFIRWAFRMIWPELHVMNLASGTKRRAVQFSVMESWRGMLPSLLLMGRRREKIAVLLHRKLMP